MRCQDLPHSPSRPQGWRTCLPQPGNGVLGHSGAGGQGDGAKEAADEPPRGSPPQASGALARRLVGSPGPKHTASVASNFFTSPDKVQRKKEARAKGIRAGGKNKHMPALRQLYLKALQKPDVLVSQDMLFTLYRCPGAQPAAPLSPVAPTAPPARPRHEEGAGGRVWGAGESH